MARKAQETGDNLRVYFHDLDPRTNRSPIRIACVRASEAAQRAGYRSSPSKAVSLALGSLGKTQGELDSEITRRVLEELERQAEKVKP